MYQLTAEYIGGLRTNGVHVKSGNTLITDAPTDNNGKGEAYSPTDLVCAALCNCMMTIMGIVSDRDAISLAGLKAAIEKTMTSELPRKIAKIKIEFTHPNPTLLTQKDKDVLKRSAFTCPVALSLHPEIVQDISFNF
ncbi:OsmC family protein [uncultured Cytophaga sp.]|uniref:OsmC family protein n=1 Tax=uncultured Cytophaga sp. TaxID=160238 RepID=UPI00260B2706|nr:OsmC family protein [uncultured Cytophaga sp.]